MAIDRRQGRFEVTDSKSYSNSLRRAESLEEKFPVLLNIVLVTVIEIEISRREYPVSLSWEMCPLLARVHLN